MFAINFGLMLMTFAYSLIAKATMRLGRKRNEWKVVAIQLIALGDEMKMLLGAIGLARDPDKWIKENIKPEAQEQTKKLYQELVDFDFSGKLATKDIGIQVAVIGPDGNVRPPNAEEQFVVDQLMRGIPPNIFTSVEIEDEDPLKFD